MNRALAASILGAALTISGTCAMANTILPLDPHHTSANFSVAHLTITKVNGTIPLESSHLVVDSKGIPTSAEATFDLTKIDTKDDLRDKDLRSDKWFNAVSYPTLTFKSTIIRPGVGGTFTLSGLLTFHGQTHPITLKGTYSGKMTDPYGKVHLGYSATGTIDRTVWGVGNAPSALVGNDIAIDIEAEAIQ